MGVYRLVWVGFVINSHPTRSNRVEEKSTSYQLEKIGELSLLQVVGGSFNTKKVENCRYLILYLVNIL